MNKVVFIFFSFLFFIMLTSCDSLSQKAGTFSVKFSWAKDEAGKEVKPDISQGEYYITVRIYEWKEGIAFPGDIAANGKQLIQSDPAQMKVTGTSIGFGDLSYGNRHFVVAEIREGAELTGGILFSGMSTLFDFKAGKHTEVNVEMSMTPTPGIDEEGNRIDAELRIVDETGNLRSYTSGTDLKVKLRLLNAVSFTKVYIANKEENLKTESGKLYDISELGEIADSENGYEINEEWDLSLGLTADEISVLPELKVYARLENEYGTGLLVMAKIALDSIGPDLTLGLNPSYSNGSKTITLNISANELIRHDSLNIETSNNKLAFDCPVPTNNESLSFTCTVETLDAALADGDYEITVTATDQAGNSSEEKTTLAVDREAPELTFIAYKNGTEVDDTIYLKENDEFKIELTLSKEPSGTPAVRLGNGKIDCERTDDLKYSCTADIKKVTYSEGISDLSVGYQDLAENQFNELIILGIAVDYTAPQMASYLLDPQNAKEGTVVTSSVIFDEQVKDFAINDAGLGLSCSNEVGSLKYICQHTIKSSKIEKDYAVIITAKDMAGNPLKNGNIGSVLVDMTPPEITVDTCTVATRRAITKNGIAAATDGDIIEITLGINKETELDSSISLGGKTLVENCETPSENCFAYTVSGSDSEGYKFVGIDAVDVAGNVYSETIDLENCLAVFDFTGPVLASAVISRIPDYTPARDNTNKILSFSLNDPLTDEVVTARINLFADEEISSSNLEITGFNFGSPVEVVDNYAQFSRMLDSGTAEGTKDLSVSWQDVLGNSATRAIDWKMFVDKAEPGTEVIEMEKVLYTRKPWGTDDTGGVPKFSVAGEEAVTSDQISTVIAYSDMGAVIGNAAVSGGSFSIPNLVGGDLPEIYLNPVKKSGVKASGAGALVTEISWHATMGGKVPGSTLVNPHVFISEGQFNERMLLDFENIYEPINGGSEKFIQTGKGAEWKKQVDWVENPSLRKAHVMAYDNATGKIIMFGGDSSSNKNNETWEWDGTKWTLSNPIISPSARHSSAMAYDSVRGKMVLFGGETTIPHYNNDTWEWDGENWKELNPVTKPSARSGHAMAYDSVRGKVVMFGGTSGGDETWEWDGINWTQMNPVVSPSKREGHSITYDSNREKTVMFGGNTWDGEEIYYNDMWEWDGENWIEIDSSTKPSPRFLLSMTYDKNKSKTILFGGYTASGRSDETWEWDGTDWTQLYPSKKPSARNSHSMVYDCARDKVVLFGGYFENDETWEWDGENWRKLILSSKPLHRSDHSMDYDHKMNRLFLMGGSTDFGSSNDMWEWRGGFWSQITPTHSPSARFEHTMVYDVAQNITMMFGGYPANNETWEWNGLDWAERLPSTFPSVGGSHAVAYDFDRNRVVLFGGNAASVNKNETWEWDGNNWTLLNPGTKPSPRNNHSMAYDKKRKRVVMFGGWTDSGNNDETWEWDGTDWTLASPTTKPSARADHSMVYDVERERIILFGGNAGGRETWEWDGNNWQRLNPVSSPSARLGYAMAYDILSDKIIMFGGYTASGRSDETWEWDGGGSSRAGHIMSASFFSSGTSFNDIVLKSISTTFNAGGTGYTGESCSAVNGAKMMVWNTAYKSGAWLEVATNTNGSSTPGLIEFSTDDPDIMGHIFFGDDESINFAVVPVSSNGCGTEMGSIATDYAEVVIKYTITE